MASELNNKQNITTMSNQGKSESDIEKRFEEFKQQMEKKIEESLQSNMERTEKLIEEREIIKKDLGIQLSFDFSQDKGLTGQPNGKKVS